MISSNKSVTQIKDTLSQNPGKGLILYCAGLMTRRLIAELAEQDITPLCVCDSNPSLHGTLCEGIEVMSIDAANERFGDFLVFIANNRFLFEIIRQLNERGKVESEKIINYVPLVKKKGCKHLFGRCIASNNRLYFCCAEFGRKWEELPSVPFEDDYDKLADDFVALREKILYELEQGITNQCTNCPLVEDIWISQNPFKIESFAYGGFGVCNFKCIYCMADKTGEQTIILKPWCQSFFKKGLMDTDSLCQFADGEITINPDKKEIYEYLNEFSQINISTNGLIYSPEIAELLNSGKCNIIVSMDAGTAETFAKIKSVDGWERVCDTLRKYSAESEKAIVLKYILLPDINETREEIDGFFELVREIKPRHVIISTDFINPNLTFSEHSIEMAKYFCNQAEKLLIPCMTSSHALSKATGIFCSHN
ncbi:MAG: radical SAM protein [Oscillospiraceae bacterium]|nr:radical SAM protein [Oscillospiraceae bacterium]